VDNFGKLLVSACLPVDERGCGNVDNRLAAARERRAVALDGGARKQVEERRVTALAQAS
jgi:hypothetical protein